jgi:hypothetical protein
MFAVQQYAVDSRGRFPFLRQPKSPSMEIEKFGKLTSSNLLVVPLTQLGNIRVGDVDEWIRDVVKPRDASAMIKRFHDVLDDPAFFGADGVPMSRFVDRATRTGALDLFVAEDATGQRMGA